MRLHFQLFHLIDCFALLFIVPLDFCDVDILAVFLVNGFALLLTGGVVLCPATGHRELIAMLLESNTCDA